MTSIWAFDFDGVLCDSAIETGTAGWRACVRLWGLHAAEEAVAGLIEKFVLVRVACGGGASVAVVVQLVSSYTIACLEITTKFQPELKAATLQRTGQTQRTVEAAFKAARDGWIATDRAGWLATHGFYDVAIAAVQKLAAAAAEGTGPELYIITTKGKEFALELLKAAAVPVPEHRVFGLGSGPKPEVLARLLEEHSAAPTKCVFVEDRLATLHAVQTAPRLDGVALVLADWGYNTAAQRAEAAGGGIAVLDQPALADALATPDLHDPVHAAGAASLFASRM